jgi:hypothetical protein
MLRDVLSRKAYRNRDPDHVTVRTKFFEKNLPGTNPDENEDELLIIIRT